MNRAGFLFFALLFTLLPALHAEESTTAISPSTLIIRRQTKSNWANNAPAILGEARRPIWAKPGYLAVKTSKTFPAEVQNLWPKLINSRTTVSFFSHGLDSLTYSNLELRGIMIFDTRHRDHCKQSGLRFGRYATTRARRSVWRLRCAVHRDWAILSRDRWWKPLSRWIDVARNARMCGKRSFGLPKRIRGSCKQPSNSPSDKPVTPRATSSQRGCILIRSGDRLIPELREWNG